MNVDNIEVLTDNKYHLYILLQSIPGTLSHSKNCVQLVESIGSELEVDTHFLKLAALYHDIGKAIIGAKYFCENQGDDEENPHDNLEPWISHRIISSHVGEGVQVLINDSNIPRKVIEIISQHHGTCPMKYFLKKSKSKNIDNYRYKCTPPQSLESCILMLVDQLEASARALSLANKLNVDELVEDVVEELILDEQLDAVEFTFGKFRRIKEILKREINSQFHKRVDYDKDEEADDDSEKPRKRRGKKDPTV